MAVIVLLSPGGSPGVTTLALALAMSWPREVILAECDPAGGTVLAGLWRGQASGGGGLVRFALAAQRDAHAAARSIRAEALPLQELPGGRFVLPAPPGPLPARQLATAWPALAASFAAAEADVIADAGRFDADPAVTPLLAGAARVLMVCRPLIRQAAAAKPRLETLARIRATGPAAELLLAGKGPYGADGPKAFTEALGVPVRAVLPWDPAAAGVLADGTRPRHGFGRSALMRAATALAARLARDTAAQPAAGVPAEVPQ
jgi:hypothetical protein